MGIPIAARIVSAVAIVAATAIVVLLPLRMRRAPLTSAPTLGRTPGYLVDGRRQASLADLPDERMCQAVLEAIAYWQRRLKEVGE
jgi:hypothetical protein